ncbi:E3 ubiquitin ligase TRIM40 isoform X2 [Rhinolophus ferrumequinum]|uniref:Tripartite motif containing 40 n=1 Tax=Rhinolophus ferrumequinum TaxID=59479 RepID=A0A671E3U7_RHIFE|nr:E3 ubiquitin ligase TRIM40 isoform X2 [Rhinolophus ferrumequinum]
MVPLWENSWEEGVCPICQEHRKEAVSTDCGHLFCRVCLAQYVEKASASGGFCCPLCRKPCSEEVLGAGYICHSHQKKVCWFCEESRLLLCMECLVSPEHRSHRELAIKDAISHYKKRLTCRKRKLKKYIRELRQLRAQEEERLQALQFLVDCGPEWGSQQQTERQLDDIPQQWPDQLEGTPAEMSRSLDISRTITQLHSLVSDLERMARELDASMLKTASDLLTRSAPQKLEAIYPKLEKKVNESLLQASSATPTCSSLISDSPHSPRSPAANLSGRALSPPAAASGLPSPEHFPQPHSHDLVPESLTPEQSSQPPS